MELPVGLPYEIVPFSENSGTCYSIRYCKFPVIQTGIFDRKEKCPCWPYQQVYGKSV